MYFSFIILAKSCKKPSLRDSKAKSWIFKSRVSCFSLFWISRVPSIECLNRCFLWDMYIHTASSVKMCWVERRLGDGLSVECPTADCGSSIEHYKCCDSDQSSFSDIIRRPKLDSRVLSDDQIFIRPRALSDDQILILVHYQTHILLPLWRCGAQPSDSESVLLLPETYICSRLFKYWYWYWCCCCNTVNLLLS